MQFSRALSIGLAATALMACSEDPISKEVSPEASAAIRWVNAVPDTVGMDYRVVDYPSNASEPDSATWARAAAGGSFPLVPTR